MLQCDSELAEYYGVTLNLLNLTVCRTASFNLVAVDLR